MDRKWYICYLMFKGGCGIAAIGQNMIYVSAIKFITGAKKCNLFIGRVKRVGIHWIEHGMFANV